MTNIDGLSDLTLLSLCAVLRSFDRNMLLSLGSWNEFEVDKLLSSDFVEHDSSSNVYRPRGAERSSVYRRLRPEQPQLELTLHQRAFDFFVHRVRNATSESEQSDAEARSLYHLEQLRDLLADNREWSRLAAHIAAFRAAEPRRLHHRRLLAVHEAFVAVRTQQYERGEAILLRLLETADVEPDVRVRALHVLGVAYWCQTRYDRALWYCQQYYELARELGDLSYQARALNNMSMIFNYTGYYARSLELLTHGLEVYRAMGDRSGEAMILSNIGNTALHLGRWDVAQDHIQQAIDLFTELGVEAPLANLLWCQGYLEHILADETASEDSYRRGLSIALSADHGDPQAAMDLWMYLGILLATQERWEEALECYDQAIVHARRLNERHLLSLIHYRRAEVFRRMDLHDDAMAAYRRAIEVVEDLGGVTDDEVLKIGLLGTVQQVYESMVLLCLELGRPEEAFNYVERARSRAFLDTLARKAPDLYSAVEQPVATLAEVQARLPGDAVLVEYFTTGVVPRGEHLINRLPPSNVRLRKHLTAPPTVLIFAVTRDGLEVFRPALDPNTLRPLPNDPGPGRRMLWRQRLLAELHERIVAPFQHLLRGREQLYLIPHGPLHYVPFMALCSARGEFLLDRGGPAIAMAPSATILLRNCLGRPAQRGAGLLAVGYNGAGDRELRFAEAEARAIAELMNGEAWTGPAPKGDQIVEPAARARWLHFAGHAVYTPHDPLESALLVSKDEALTARAIIGGLDLRADLVTLSACTSGLSHVVPGDELLGLQRAFLYAGVPSVVCTLWEANDLVALLVMEHLYTALRADEPAAAALRDAQVSIREMTGRDLRATLARWQAEHSELVAALGDLPDVPDDQLDARLFADPFFWAPFMLIGRPR